MRREQEDDDDDDDEAQKEEHWLVMNKNEIHWAETLFGFSQSWIRFIQLYTRIPAMTVQFQ